MATATKARGPKAGTPEHVAQVAQVAHEAAQVAEAARLDLERAMIAYRLAGASLRAVGEAGGMSAQAVVKMLRRNGVEHPRP